MATARMPHPHVDPVKADARHYTVEFENDKVRVVRIKYGAKEKSVMHGHPESIAVFLNDCKARFTYPDGKSENIEAKSGQVMFTQDDLITGEIGSILGTPEPKLTTNLHIAH